MIEQDKLSVDLQAQFERWRGAWKPQEDKWLNNYSDMMRIVREDDTKGTGAAKAEKSRIFIGSTRGKIRSAKAKIKDALFGVGRLPFDTNPTKEELKEYADTVEAILTYQLNEMKFRGVLGTGVDSLCVYGTSYMCGPFQKSKTHTSVDNSIYGLQEQTHDYPEPYYEHARTMDVYPDPDAEDEHQGRGVYWAGRKQPHEIRSWKGGDYNDEAIDYALTQLVQSSSEGSDRTIDARANLSRFTEDGRIWVQRFFGLVNKADLAEFNGEKPKKSKKKDDDEIEAIVIMAGGIVVKATENPNPKRPIKRCVYEEVEHEINGVGIAENNEPHQKVTNAAFRLYMEGKSFALLKTCSVDRSKFEAGEDFALFPGKRYQMKPGLTPDERKTAIIWHDMMDVTNGWENVIQLSEKFSDDDTGITKYTQGNDSGNYNKTASGINLIMNAASLPMKEVLMNIDLMWIESMIEDLIQWNIEFLEPDTVALLIGDKQAQTWNEIKQFGKANFMDWKATGAATFMAKEVLMNKLQGFMQIALGNQVTAQYIDARELLDQVWAAGEIGKESPVLTDEDMQKKQNNPQLQEMQQQAQQFAKQVGEQAQQQVQQVQQQAQDAISKAQEQVKTMEQKVNELNLALRDKSEAIASNERVKMSEFKLKGYEHLVPTPKEEAEIDLLQAKTVQTLVDATAEPDEELMSDATSREHLSE